MVAEVKPERRMKQSEPVMNAKEEGSTIWRDTERNDKENEGDPSKRKGDEKEEEDEEEEEVQVEMKEVGDSVHTGEKNLMPSMLKRGWGRIPLLLSMGNAREYERNKVAAAAPQRSTNLRGQKKRPISRRIPTENSGKETRDTRKGGNEQARSDKRMISINEGLRKVFGARVT